MIRILFLFFFPVLAFAGECHLYKIEGRVALNGSKATLKTNEGTQSEKTFHLDGEPFLRAAPYVGKFAVGAFLFGDKGPVQNAEIIKVETIDRGVPDPLKPAQIQHLGKRPCP